MKAARLVVTIICMFSGLSPANTIYVDVKNATGPWDGSSEHPFSKIQDAVNAADVNGTEILVASGQYYEMVSIHDKNVSLTSLDPNDPYVVEWTIIDAGNSGEDTVGITIRSSDKNARTTIRGFTIRNATYAGIDGGITSPVIQQCKITRCNVGIIFQGGNEETKMGNPIITECDMWGNGEGIWCLDGTNATIINCDIDNSTGAGVMVSTAFFTEEATCRLQSLLLTGNGEGIAVDGNCIIDDCEIRYSVGNGISVWQGPLKISNTKSHINQTGLFIGHNTAIINARNCLLVNNSENGILNTTSSAVNIENCTLAGNLKYGVKADNSGTEIENCIIWGNSLDGIFASQQNVNINYSDIQQPWPGEGNINLAPLFADETNTNLHDRDYHLKCQGGRWQPDYVTNWRLSHFGQWVYDDITSPCIDAGNPSSNYGNEPLPNGKRINMGVYGNTGEASRSAVNGMHVDINNVSGPWDGSIEHPFNKIQDGIDSVMNGGVVIVAPGRYFECLSGYADDYYDVYKNFTLTSSNPSDPNIMHATIIDANGAECGIVFGGDNVIEGFTITGARWAGVESEGGLVRNCLITGNDNGVYASYAYDLLVKNCSITANGTGIFCYTRGSAQIENCIIEHNGTGLATDDDSYPRLKNCSISYNVDEGVWSQISGPELFDTVISNNGGHGVVTLCQDALEMTNCLVTGNGGDGLRIRDIDSSYWVPDIKNCTIASNAGYGVVFVDIAIDSQFSNSIIWGNGSGSISWNYMDPDEFDINVSYCDIQYGWPGTGNINSDPLFADATISDPNVRDYHLKSHYGRWNPATEQFVTDSVTSPCIDTGDPLADWGDEHWRHGKRINMGAYGGTVEASLSAISAGNVADLTHDDIVNFLDFARFAQSWLVDTPLEVSDFDVNGSVDETDLGIFADNWLYFMETGHWTFDNDANDSSICGNNGTFISSPSWAEGKFNDALYFDGFEDAVQVPTTYMNYLQGSVSLWVRPAGFTSNPQYIFGHAVGSWADRIQLYVDDPNGWLDLGMSGSHHRRLNIIQLLPTQWYHIVLIWDNGAYRVYVDGVLRASGSYVNLDGLASFADIGNSGNPDYRQWGFKGTIDEVHIYNRALSNNEVLRLFYGVP